MSRPFLWLALALAAAPAFAFLVYRLAKGLGYLDPPINRQHELRRTISLAVYAFLLFLPVLIYGFEKRWPRAWIFFGILDGGALLFFAGSGLWAARELWRIRHPETLPALTAETPAGESPSASASASASIRPAPDDALAQAPLAGATPPLKDEDEDATTAPPAGR